jgi:hypothetical protein
LPCLLLFFPFNPPSALKNFTAITNKIACVIAAKRVSRVRQRQIIFTPEFPKPLLESTARLESMLEIVFLPIIKAHSAPRKMK